MDVEGFAGATLEVVEEEPISSNERVIRVLAHVTGSLVTPVTGSGVTEVTLPPVTHITAMRAPPEHHHPGFGETGPEDGKGVSMGMATHDSRPLRGRAGRRIPGEGYDLVTMFDCLHDMGDPVAAARHVLETLADDGTSMIVEPAAGDCIEDNLNPVGRAYCGFSTLLCTPASLWQGVRLALGAEAGEARIRDVVAAAGFRRFRRLAETPFNFVFEARR